MTQHPVCRVPCVPSCPCRAVRPPSCVRPPARAVSGRRRGRSVPSCPLCRAVLVVVSRCAVGPASCPAAVPCRPAAVPCRRAVPSGRRRVRPLCRAVVPCRPAAVVSGRCAVVPCRPAAVVSGPLCRRVRPLCRAVVSVVAVVPLPSGRRRVRPVTVHTRAHKKHAQRGSWTCLRCVLEALFSPSPDCAPHNGLQTAGRYPELRGRFPISIRYPFVRSHPTDNTLCLLCVILVAPGQI